MENRPFLSKLIFLNVSEHDYGNYTCVATNKLGHTNASITLFGETEPQAGQREREGRVEEGGRREGQRGRGRESGVARQGWVRRARKEEGGGEREREREPAHV